MPRVQRYSQQQVATRPRATVRRQAAETFASQGGPQGQAIAAFGAEATRIGLELRSREHERADVVALTTAERQLGDLEHQLTTDPDHGFQRVTGRDVLPLRQLSMELFDQQADMIASNLTSDRQRQAFARAREQRRSSILEGIERHTARELAAYDKGEAEAGLTTAVNLAIANAENVPRVAEELARVEQIVETHAAVLGLSGPEARHAFVADLRSKVHVGVVERLIGLDRDQDAQEYFHEVRDQLNGSAIGPLEEKLELATTDGEALRASEEIWTALGPTDDTEPIALDVMEAEARRRFAGNTKVLRATIDWLRQRKAGVDSGRKEREDAVLSDVWGAVLDGRSMTEIRRLPAFVAAPGRVQIQIRDYYANESWRNEQRAATRAGRAAAEESRALTRLQREDKLREMDGWAAYFDLSDPQRLRDMSRGEILAQLPTLGREHVNRLLTDQEQLLRSDAAVRSATIDTELFNSIANEAGLDYVFDSQKSNAQKANIGQLQATVEAEIARRQQAKNGVLTYDEKRATMEAIVQQRVKVDDWFWDTDTIAALVHPDDRRAAYVPLQDIARESRLYQDALNYLRGLPGSAALSESQLRARYGTRIERAVGRSLAGGTRQDIEDALRGVD
jgi:hypothetical protein